MPSTKQEQIYRRLLNKRSWRTKHVFAERDFWTK